MHTADAYIAETGVIVEQVIDTTESGQPITAVKKNPALLVKGRAMKDVIWTLKEFGCLDDRDSQMAESTMTLAEVLSDE
jgi:hypothetical protein